MRFLCLVLLAFTVLSSGPARARDIGDQIKVAAFGVETGMFNALFAKELCTCMYLDDLTMEDCVARDNLPAAVHKIIKLTPKSKITDSSAPKTLKAEFVSPILVKLALKSAGSVAASTIGPAASARFVDARRGCVLVP